MSGEEYTIAEAHVIAVSTRRNIRTVRVTCPYGAQVHVHGWPIGNTEEPGSRVSHCQNNARCYHVVIDQ